MLGQWHHQLIIRKAVEKLEGVVELGTELVSESIAQDDDGVDVKLQKMVGGTVVEETARFKYVVGADGAHSKFFILDISEHSDSGHRQREKGPGHQLRWRDTNRSADVYR